MNKVTLVIISLLMLAGCAKEQDLTQKSASVAPEEEVVKQEAGAVEEKIMEAGTEGTSALDESGFQVVPPVDIAQEMQAQIKDTQQQKTLVEPIAGTEGIIAENRWGFSIYDPQTGIEEFYTSKSTLLGSRTRQ
jgi:uncharacterized protein YcfL